jgi:hypothetical protein
MTFNLLILVGAIVAAWAVLSLVGGERQRRLDAIEAENAASDPLPGPGGKAAGLPAARQSVR